MALVPIKPRPGIEGDEERYKRDLEDMRKYPHKYGQFPVQVPLTETDIELPPEKPAPKRKRVSKSEN